MRYISTRGQAPALGFDEVLLAGLARDGGLYLPESWPALTPDRLRSLAGLSYPQLAAEVMRPFVAGSAVEDRFDQLVAEAYAGFEHSAVTPLRQLDANEWLLELFHGPTLAFKDVAMQFLGRIFDAVLEARDERVTILGATSGDTGAAAVEAFAGRSRVDLFMLHPEGRVSEVQRRQMTTVQADNVHNLAVRGTFDDCQDLVKACFNDHGFRDGLHLSAVNSINWARVMAQIVYYVASAVALGAPERRVAFAVPTGNFGNVFAGHAARCMGLPMERLVVASNSNDILARFFERGEMAIETVVPTLSPSMDIQVSSNFERLLFELLDGQGAAVAETLTTFRREGRFALPDSVMEQVRAGFDGYRLDDAGTVAEIARCYAACGAVLDPHSAVGLAAARERRGDPAVPMITLATAHPAKFPDAVERAIGQRPALPPRLADLHERPECLTVVPADEAQLKAFIGARARVQTEAA
ncbi:threonine synthase [Aquibaculum sediminis]|uniref:threonine synthase n=1 Tax=Aquibaculum sediminis TaxID=3231907 RepID=UPI003454D82B